MRLTSEWRSIKLYCIITEESYCTAPFTQVRYCLLITKVFMTLFNIKTVVRLTSSELAVKKGHQVDLYSWQLHGHSHVFVALSVLKQLTLSPFRMSADFPVNGHPQLYFHKTGLHHKVLFWTYRQHINACLKGVILQQCVTVLPYWPVW